MDQTTTALSSVLSTVENPKLKIDANFMAELDITE
jgi:hypothetical protein